MQQTREAIGRLIARVPVVTPAETDSRNWVIVLRVGRWARDVARECWPLVRDRIELASPALELDRYVEPDDATAALWIARLHRVLVNGELPRAGDAMDFAIAALADPPLTECDFYPGQDDEGTSVLWVKTSPQNKFTFRVVLSLIALRTLRCAERVRDWPTAKDRSMEPEREPTMGDLMDAAGIGDDTFRRIRAAANIEVTERGGAAGNRRYSPDEVSRLVDAVLSGNFRNRTTVAERWARWGSNKAASKPQASN